MISEIENKSIVILGAARSGIAAAKLLQQKGAQIFVSDSAQAIQKQEEIEILDQRDIEYEFGSHSDKIYKADFVVLSPGIPKTSKPVMAILSKKIPVYSELEIASWFCKSPIIAITGSNGKTTTTALLGEMIKSELPGSIVAGNIGSAFSDHVGYSCKTDWAVVEVSSFQLETVETFHPKVVIPLLNIAPNHLDWYKSYKDYIEAKMLILKNLTPEDVLIYNQDDVVIREKIVECEAIKYSFSLKDVSASAFYQDKKLYLNGIEFIKSDQIRLNGLHNYQNSLAAILAARHAGISKKSIIGILKNFKGVEHRLEYVTRINDIHFINDSKATTIESLAVALDSFNSPIILIAGGKDKGGEYGKLNNLISENVRAAVLIGAAKEKMAHTWNTLIPVHMSETLGEAVEKAFQLGEVNDNILLSPACSSFDMFKDFEDRGRNFKDIVKNLKEKNNDR